MAPNNLGTGTSSESANLLREQKSATWVGREAVAKYLQRRDPSYSPLNSLHTVFLETCRRLCAPGSYVLDLGCGTGAASLPLVQHGCRVVGVDISQEMLDALRELDQSNTIELRQGSVFEIPASDGEFDAVVSLMVMGHFPDWHLIVKEAARCCRKGGVIALHFLNTDHLDIALEEYGETSVQVLTNRTTAPPGCYASSGSYDEIKTVCRLSGLELRELIPFNFFNDNAILGHALGTEKHRLYLQQVCEFLSDPKVLAFAQWFEETVIARLPYWMSYSSVVVAERV